MAGEDYGFLYHRNTYTKKWGAMTANSVASYFNGEKGDYVRAKTRVGARELLKEKLYAK